MVGIATAYTLNQTGEYGTAANWTPNGVPDASTGDTITDLGGFTLQIEANHDVISIADSTGSSTIDMSYSAGTYTFEVQGNCNLSNVTLTYGSGELKMNSSGATLTTGASSDEFNNLNIADNCTLAGVQSFAKGSGTVTIASGKTFTINVNFFIENGQIANVSASGGIWSGAGIVYMRLWGASQTMSANMGTINNAVIMYVPGTEATADRTITLGAALDLGSSLEVEATDPTFKCKLALGGFGLTTGGQFKVDTRGVLVPGNTGELVEVNGNVDTNNGEITNGGTDSWTLQVIGPSRTINTTGDAIYNLNIGDGSTTTDVTASSNTQADNYTLKNLATFNRASYTHTVTSGWYAQAGSTSAAGTATVKCTGTGARTQVIDILDTDANEFYILDIDDDYSITAGELAVYIIDGGAGTHNGLQIAAGKVLTLAADLYIVDRRIAYNDIQGTISSTTGSLGFLLDTNSSVETIDSTFIGNVDDANTIMKVASTYTGGVDGNLYPTSTWTCKKLTVTSDHATYLCRFYPSNFTLDIGTGGILVNAKGKLENATGPTNTAIWGSDGPIDVYGTLNFYSNILGTDSTLTMAADQDITFYSGCSVDLSGYDATIETTVTWSGAGANYIIIDGGTVVMDYVEVSGNCTGVAITGSADVDIELTEFNCSVTGLAITSDFTLTKFDNVILIGTIALDVSGSGVIGDYSFTNCTLTGGTFDVAQYGSGILEFITPSGLGTVNIGSAVGGVIGDTTGPNIKYFWGVASLSDATNIGSWTTGDTVIAMDDDSVLGGTHDATLSWDADLDILAVATEAGSTIKMVNGGIMRYNKAGGLISVQNVGDIQFDLGNGESASIYAIGAGYWTGGAPTFSSTCKGTVYFGSVSYDGPDFNTDSLSFDIDGNGVTVELVGTCAFYTGIIRSGDTLQSPNNGGANTQSSDALTIEGTFTYGNGTITNDHTWTMANGADIIIDGGTFNATGQSLTPTNGVVSFVWIVNNGGNIECDGTIVWDYVNVDYMTALEFVTGSIVTIDNSNLEADNAAGFGLLSTGQASLSMDNTTIAGNPGYALFWTANNVDCTGTVQNCTLAGSIRDIYLDSENGVLELIDCDDDGIGGRLEVEVPRGGISDDGYTMDNHIYLYGRVYTSDLGNSGNWAIGDILYVYPDAASNDAVVYLDSTITLHHVETQTGSAGIIVCSGSVRVSNTGVTTIRGTSEFRCMDGMVYGSTGGAHRWSGNTPNIGYDYLNKPIVHFRYMDFGTNSIAISTTNEDVILQTSGNIYWYTLTVKEGDEWRHLDAGTTITWTGGQTSYIDAGTTTTDGFMRVIGASGNNIIWTTTGTDHIINVSGNYQVKFVSVDHSDASGGKTIFAIDSTNNLNNTNWWFTGDTQWQGMSPNEVTDGSTTLTPSIVGDAMFNLALNAYEHKTMRQRKPTVDQNLVEIRGRRNIGFTLTCIDLNSGFTDLKQFETWWRQGTTLTINDIYTNGPLQFGSYQPAGWRVVSVDRDRALGTTTVYYSVNFEEVP